jgi:transcription initiation factor TFIID subunit 2
VGATASTSSRDIQIQEYAEGEYNIKKAIPKALSIIRSQTGFSPPEIEAFLLQLLLQNDNSKNFVNMTAQSAVADDCFYIGSLVLSLSVLAMEHRRLREEASSEMLRLLHYDDVQPSYGRTITICCLEVQPMMDIIIYR